MLIAKPNRHFFADILGHRGRINFFFALNLWSLAGSFAYFKPWVFAPMGLRLNKSVHMLIQKFTLGLARYVFPEPHL